MHLGLTVGLLVFIVVCTRFFYSFKGSTSSWLTEFLLGTER